MARRRQRRMFTAAESAEVWDRWQRGEGLRLIGRVFGRTSSAIFQHLKPHGGKQKLGAISRMGERSLRRLLIIGASAVVLHASKRGAPPGSWLERMLARKPRMLVTVALANKTARIVWALLKRNEIYRAPVPAAA
jgi:hypothetical protein